MSGMSGRGSGSGGIRGVGLRGRWGEGEEKCCWSKWECFAGIGAFNLGVFIFGLLGDMGEKIPTVFKEEKARDMIVVGIANLRCARTTPLLYTLSFILYMQT